MKIKVFSENIQLSDKYSSEHGLSMYIETEKKKILFDMGASDIFLKNAKTMGVNIKDIDFAVISHGHSDHGGGLEHFVKTNNTAKIYIHKDAFKKQYSYSKDGVKKYIGLNSEVQKNDNLIFIDDSIQITSEINLFSNVKLFEPLLKTNKNLYIDDNGNEINDDFSHEINLIIRKDEKIILFIGCGHRGIINIMKHCRDRYGRYPDYVLGGFHLFSRSAETIVSEKYIEKLAEQLKNTNSIFYTCHCTGVESYNKLKSLMEDRIFYLKSGSEIEI